MNKKYNEWMSNERDSYLIDLENEILNKYGFHFTKLKKERINHNEWIDLIKRFMDNGVYEEKEFIEYYKIWVLNGGGDEWFQ